jgi:hypothetical protein
MRVIERAFPGFAYRMSASALREQFVAWISCEVRLDGVYECRAKHQKPPPDPFSREEAELISTETFGRVGDITAQFRESSEHSSWK